MARTKLTVRRGVTEGWGLRQYPDEKKTFISKPEERSTEYYTKMRRVRLRIPARMLGRFHRYGPWANLTGDILRRIMEMLFIGDQVVLSVVCKDWNLAATRATPVVMNQAPAAGAGPWKLFYIWEKSESNPKLNFLTELHDPSSRRTHLMEVTQWHSKVSFSFGATPCFLRHGWLLFAKKYRCKSHFFLYHVYSKRRIFLPSLGHYFDVAIFSKNPHSPDCVVLASYHSRSGVYVATCAIGDESWKTTQLVDAEGPLSSAVYSEEKDEFHFVFPGGNLGRFGASDGSWNLLTEKGHGLDLQERSHHHLLPYEGELLLVVKNMYFRFHIFRFDWSAVKWEALSTDPGGATILEFNDLFTKKLGNGAFLFMNQRYLSADPKEIWVDPPTLAN